MTKVDKLDIDLQEIIDAQHSYVRLSNLPFIHVATFFTRENYTPIGHNTVRIKAGRLIGASVHAEIDATQKLNRHLKICFKSVNLLSIRVNKSMTLGNGRPCEHCIRQLEKFSGLRINYVYYSDSEGIIRREKFHKVLQTENHISKGFRK